MPRLLLNRATGALLTYPRQDDEPVVGLDRTAAYVVEIIREPEPTDYNPHTHIPAPLEPVVDITDPDSADVNGTATYGWGLVPIVPPTPAPDWSGFQAELLQSTSFAAARIGARQALELELPTSEGVRQQRLLRANTALSALDAAVLGAASDQAPFIRAWLNLRQASLVSPEVAAGMAQIATACRLPPDLIRSLGAPDSSFG
jgi:hypothetical protein